VAFDFQPAQYVFGDFTKESVQLNGRRLSSSRSIQEFSLVCFIIGFLACFSHPTATNTHKSSRRCYRRNCGQGNLPSFILRSDLFHTAYYLTMVDLVDRICVMLEQESRFYDTEDYLAPEFQQKLAPLSEVEDLDPREPSPTTTSSAASSSAGSSSSINETWREKICEWSYQVVDHFDFSREVVSVSISYLDRYLATRAVNKKMFQLAAMTTLFIAIKLYEPGRLSIPSMIELSRGYFMVEQMSAMEMSILRCVSRRRIFRGGLLACFARQRTPPVSSALRVFLRSIVASKNGEDKNKSHSDTDLRAQGRETMQRASCS